MLKFILDKVDEFLKDVQSERLPFLPNPESHEKVKPPPRGLAFEPKVLLLVIRSQGESMLVSLNVEKQIHLDLCKSLYRATQALWMGSNQEFQRSGLGHWFSREYEVPCSSQSEYDVFFIKIEIESSDMGFQPGATQIERHDAFHKLPELAKNVVISPRLPSKAYGNGTFYKR